MMRYAISLATAFFILVLIVLAIAAMMSPRALAQAPPPCGPYDDLAKVLTEQFREHLALVGLAEDGRRIEIWATDDGNTFSLLIEHPRLPGAVCLIGNGTDLRAAPAGAGQFKSLNRA